MDVALNTLSGEALQATFSCVAPFGKFIDLAKENSQTNARLEMAPFDKSVSFTSVNMAYLRQQNVKFAGRIFQEAMKFVMNEKLQAVSPIDLRSWSKLTEAIEMVQNEKYTSRAIMVPTTGDQVLVAQKPPESILFNPDVSYLLAGGLGGLGRSISRWLTTHGAKNLIFVSRSGASSAEALSFISSLEDSGIRTAVLQCDISDAFALSSTLSDTLKTFPPIHGVIQGAMTLNDSLFNSMTHEQWTSTIFPKVHGSKNSTKPHSLNSWISSSSSPLPTPSLAMQDNQTTPRAVPIKSHWPSIAIS